MSSPKGMRTYKSPRNNSGKNQDLKAVQKKCEKSKEPMDKERRQKQQLKNRIMEMSDRCKRLQDELGKERLKNQMLQKQVKSLVDQLKYYKEDGKGFRQKISSVEKAKLDKDSNYEPTSTMSDQKGFSTQRKQHHNYVNAEETISVFQPGSPKQKMQVGGYFGSLFN